MRENALKMRGYFVRSRAWMSLLLLAPVAIAAVFTRPYLQFNSMWEFILEFLGWMFFFAGATLRWWATLYIGGRKDQELITQGPYSICRNPLYLGTLCMTLAVPFFVQSVSLLVAIAMVSAAYLMVTVAAEENRLESIYGEAYAAYRRRVPRLFPKPALYTSPPELTVRLQGIRAEFYRMLQWAALPMACYLIEHLRMLPEWPTPIVLP